MLRLSIFFEQILLKREAGAAKEGIIWALELLVSYHLVISDYTKALKYSLKQLSYYRDDDTSSLHSYVLYNIGSAYTNVNIYDKALKYFQKSIAPQFKHNLFYTERYADVNTGMLIIYRKLGDFQKVLALDLEYLKNIQQQGKEEEEGWNTYLNISTDYKELKQYDNAILYANKALQVFTKRKDIRLKPLAYVTLAEIFYQMHRYDEVLGALLDSMNIEAQQIMPYEYRGFVFLALVTRDAPDDVLIKHGIVPTMKYQKAIKDLEIILINSLENAGPNAGGRRRECYKELSVIYERIDDYKKAYEYYQRYIGLRDSISNQTSTLAFHNELSQILFNKQKDSLTYQQRLATEKLQHQSLIAAQQLSIANKEKALQQLSFLKTRADLLAEQNRRRPMSSN